MREGIFIQIPPSPLKTDQVCCFASLAGKAYAGYYRAKQEFENEEKKKIVRLCSLVYPYENNEDSLQSEEDSNAKKEAKEVLTERENIMCGLYGLEYGTEPSQVSTNFSIEYVEIGNNTSELIENEKNL